jgi:hypothetical protein
VRPGRSPKRRVILRRGPRYRDMKKSNRWDGIGPEAGRARGERRVLHPGPDARRDTKVVSRVVTQGVTRVGVTRVVTRRRDTGVTHSEDAPCGATRCGNGGVGVNPLRWPAAPKADPKTRALRPTPDPKAKPRGRRRRTWGDGGGVAEAAWSGCGDPALLRSLAGHAGAVEPCPMPCSADWRP